MKLSIILKGAIDKTGRQPLQIRIHEGQTRRFAPTGIKVEPTQWDKKKMQVNPTHPAYRELNKRLKVALYQAELVQEKKEQVKQMTLVAYIVQCLGGWENEKRESTLRAQRAKLSNIKRYDAKVMLHEVGPEWLQGYRTHLVKRGLSGNAVWDNFKFLRTVILKALKDGRLQVDPFRSFKMPRYSDPKKVFLIEEQVKELEALLGEAVLSPMERTVCIWFLIGCYTGLRYSDMVAFSRSWLRGDLLYLHTYKTDSPVSLELPEKVKALFESVNYQGLKVGNQVCNRIMKRLAGFAGIEEPVSMHTSRHSFATMALAKGVELPYVQEILGHTKIATTQVYAKIIAPKRHQQYRKLFE